MPTSSYKVPFLKYKNFFWVNFFYIFELCRKSGPDSRIIHYYILQLIFHGFSEQISKKLPSGWLAGHSQSNPSVSGIFLNFLDFVMS